VTVVNKIVTPILKRELLAYQVDVKGAIFRQIRETFARLKQNGFTQKHLAIKIGMNEGQLSRRMRGDYDLRLETLSDLARGLDCRIDVKLTPLSQSSTLETDRMLELIEELEGQLKEIRAKVGKQSA
jgi:transcriptional regulator with XRE-family HTH domain